MSFPEPYLAAVCQLRSTSDIEANLTAADRWIRKAAKLGARLVLTPENTPYLGPHERKWEVAQAVDGPWAQHFSALARELQIYLLLGSMVERVDLPGKTANTSLLFGPDGKLLASYRKLHLFDVDVPGGVSFRESETVIPGDKVLVVPTDLGALGLSICYDLRFGELYRALVEKGAELLAIPSAFTTATGRAHWEVLVRARAIECQAYVLAPGQWGSHDDQGLRESYGHSMIVDPWGQVLAQVPDGEGIALAEIDLSRVHRVRRAIPMAQHRRLPGL
jgi:predicted amidohydrolase